MTKLSETSKKHIRRLLIEAENKAWASVRWPNSFEEHKKALKEHTELAQARRELEEI